MSRRHSCPLLASVSGLALGCHVVSLYLGDGFLLLCLFQFGFGIHHANYNSHSSVIMSMPLFPLQIMILMTCQRE